MASPDALQRDANRVPIQGKYPFLVSKEVTFTAAGNGAVGNITLFTVTGDVLVTIFAVCSTSLTGSGTVEVGITGNTAGLIAQTTGTDIDAGEVWIDNAPATIEALPSAVILTNSTDIIQTVGSDTITAGVVTYYCLFRPLSSSATVVAA